MGETTALLLLEHNEDSEPFPRGSCKTTCHFCFRLLFGLFILADIVFFISCYCVKQNPAAAGTVCSNFVVHCSSLAYLFDYVVISHVVCMLEGYVHVR